MQQNHKKTKVLVVIISLLSSLPTFGMKPNQVPQLFQKACTICKKNKITQTITISKPSTTWRKELAYENITPLSSSEPLSPSSSGTNAQGSPRYNSPRQTTPRQKKVYRSVPTLRREQCSHEVCADCINASNSFDPDEKGCKLCPYARAQAQHAQCNIDTCHNPVEQVTQHKQPTKHTHGLCEQHGNTIEKLECRTHACNTCYAQKNPTILNSDAQCEVCSAESEHIDIKTSCSHNLCTTCKNKGNRFYPNPDNGCRLCTYIEAHIEHAQCNIDTCNNDASQLTGHRNHTHGLCDEHSAEINKKLHYNTTGCKICYAQKNPTSIDQQQRCEACDNSADHSYIRTPCTHHLCDLHREKTRQFQYSPIESIKKALQGYDCTPCFIQKNPDVTSCDTETRYWGEMALLVGTAGVILYSTKKIYTWWQERKKQQKEESAHAENAILQESVQNQ